MKKSKKQDIRVIRTRAAVRRAFLELAENKSVADISIKEIAETAKINRTTFYLHYKTIEDIYDDIINEQEVFCREIINKYHRQLINFEFADCAAEFAEHHDKIFLNNEELHGSVFTLCLRRKVSDILCEVITELYHEPEMKEKYIPLSDAVLASIVSGMVSVISTWIASDRTASLKDYCNELSYAIVNGIKKV